MTKEEAIKILYEMEFKTAYSGELGGLAVEMAVEALRNQPSLPSNLEEAARKAGKEVFAVVPGEILNENGRYCMTNDKNWPLRKHYIHGFKAGAEWMAREAAEIEKSGYNRALKAVKEKVDELYDEASIGLSEYDSGLYNGISDTCMKLRGFIKARLYLGSEED